MLYEEERRRVAEAARRLAAEGMNRGTSGNLSLRTAAREIIAVTPSALPYAEMGAADVCLLRLDGGAAEPGRKPSSESPLHLALYRARPDVNAVVHTHALFATVWSMEGGELPVVTIPAAEFAPVRTAPFALPGSEELAAGAAATLGGDSAVLLEHHGLVCVGGTLEKALSAAEYVEECAETAFYSRLLGNGRALPPETIPVLRELLRRR